LNNIELKSLSDRALDYGIQLSHSQLHLLRIYLDELWDWNLKMNLTGLSTRERMIIELFLDSLIPAPFLPKKGKMLDVGSGAGFPGLPLKILKPWLKTQLLEAHSKKVSFLKQVIRLLKLDEIKVIKGRIEKHRGNLYPAGYDLITARALTTLYQTIEWCAPHLSPGGLLITFLGSSIEEDLTKCLPLLESSGIVQDRLIPYLLPGKKSERNIVIFKKTV